MYMCATVSKCASNTLFSSEDDANAFSKESLQLSVDFSQATPSHISNNQQKNIMSVVRSW